MGAGSAYLVAGTAVYLVGTILVTFVFNVPRNNALAAVNPSSADAGRLWTEYVAIWTGWNHIRAATALIAATLLTIAFSVSRG